MFIKIESGMEINVKNNTEIINKMKYIILDGSLEINKNGEITEFKKNISTCGDYTFLDMNELIKKYSEEKNQILSQAVIITDDDELDVNSNAYRQYAVMGVGVLYHGNAPYVTLSITDIDEEYINLVYCRKHKIPVLIGETKHLIIREMCMDDMDMLFALYSSLLDCPYIEQLYERDDEEEYSRKYIENMYGFYNYGLWLIFLKEEAPLESNISQPYNKKCQYKLIGRAGIEHREIDGEMCHEIGYLIDKSYQRKGYAYEACSYIVKYAFEQLGIESLHACVNKENIPSGRLAIKLGFSRYKEIDDDIIYRISNDEHMKKPVNPAFYNNY